MEIILGWATQTHNISHTSHAFWDCFWTQKNIGTISGHKKWVARMSCQITESFWHEGWQELFSLGSKWFKCCNFPKWIEKQCWETVWLGDGNMHKHYLTDCASRLIVVWMVAWMHEFSNAALKEAKKQKALASKMANRLSNLTTGLSHTDSRLSDFTSGSLRSLSPIAQCNYWALLCWLST